MKEPKFKIGQELYFKDEVNRYINNHNRKYESLGNPRPNKLTVTNISIEICEGGIQIFYKFALIDKIVPELVLMAELPELPKGEN